MPGKKAAPVRTLLPIRKSPTGIRGLDEISGGGLPKGRTTIVCGGPGCGKNKLGSEFLVLGALEKKKTNVLLGFEKNPQDNAQNAAFMGFHVQDPSDQKK